MERSDAHIDETVRPGDPVDDLPTRITVDMPLRFPGDDADRRTNFYSHDWLTTHDGEVECADCFCKPWHAAAAYPCGTEPPRVVRVIGG
ncbi:MAG TPA: hypothetical protein VGF24_37230 [Vicinamibacterales bacterium]|jgi:hypothetical protein